MRHLTTPAVALVAAIALAGCSTDDSPTGTPNADQTKTTPSPASPSPTENTPTPTESAPTEEPAEDPTPEAGLRVVVEGDTVGPNGELIRMRAGEPLVIEFTADRAGELHVHSKPEQYVEFTEGSTTAELVIDTPGVVKVEEHETGAVVAQLEVRP